MYAAGLMAALGVGVFASDVFASIPSSTGTISACYTTKTGALKVIDAEAGKTCTSSQTPLSWTSSSQPVVSDANGQVLGTLLATQVLPSAPATPSATEVYNATLKKVVPIGPDKLNVNDPRAVVAGAAVTTFYTSSDCSGQAYTASGAIGGNDGNVSIKLDLLQWIDGSGTQRYGVVPNSAVGQTVTSNSFMDTSVGVNEGTCLTQTETNDGLYAITAISSPYATPIATPLLF